MGEIVVGNFTRPSSPGSWKFLWVDVQGNFLRVQWEQAKEPGIALVTTQFYNETSTLIAEVVEEVPWGLGE